MAEDCDGSPLADGFWPVGIWLRLGGIAAPRLGSPVPLALGPVPFVAGLDDGIVVVGMADPGLGVTGLGADVGEVVGPAPAGFVVAGFEVEGPVVSPGTGISPGGISKPDCALAVLWSQAKQSRPMTIGAWRLNAQRVNIGSILGASFQIRVYGSRGRAFGKIRRGGGLANTNFS